MKKITFILFSICLFSCENNYEISKDKLKSRFSFDHGFVLSELKVNQLNEIGKPIKYEEIWTAHYLSNHKDLGNKKSYSTFYFNKPNGQKGYEWEWRIDSNNVLFTTYTKTLPLEFKNNTWYLLNLSDGTCYINNLFFKFLDNETVEQFHNEGNCGAAW